MKAARATTGIGSLPHHNVDAALAFSFRMGIPFLPEIPIRNAWEYLIARALEGLPGLNADEDGSVTLNPDVWHARAGEYGVRLARAFDHAGTERHAFEPFEPTASVSGSWQAFVWELGERGHRECKIQVAGPITAQWAIRLKDGSPLEKHEGLSEQIYRHLLARALAMSRCLQDAGVKPMIYLDEPALYGLSLDNPRHLLGLQELKIMVGSLRKEGVTVGIHCCSNTDWSIVLGTGIDVLSIDTRLSLANLLGADASISRFLEGGGRLSLGVVPTERASALRSLDPRAMFAELMDAFARSKLGKEPAHVKKVLESAIYTPACGLALHSAADAELALALLDEFHDYTKASLK